MNYIYIDEQELIDMENSWRNDATSIEKGLFVAKCNDGYYLAMDNSNGECWVDKFNSLVLVERFFTDNLGYDSDEEMFSMIPHKGYLY